ncbi:hypothetical protein RhiirB3_455896 [Rhizophagus irregularis]|nr:hypothetical protein RhiirB3_455896 [Rhizophagus irregularis]
MTHITLNLNIAVTRKIEKRILDETQVSCELPKRKIKVTNGNETANDSESNEKSEVKQVDEEMDICNKLLAVLTAQRRRNTKSKKDCLSSICFNRILDFSNDKVHKNIKWSLNKDQITWLENVL